MTNGVPDAFAEAFDEGKQREIAARQDADPALLPGRLTPVGWVAPEGEIPFEQYETIGGKILAFRNASAWAMGDWLAEARRRYGEAWAQLVPEDSRSKQTWQNWMSVAEAWPMDKRYPGVYWSIHQELAPLSEEDRAFYMKLHIDTGIQRAELRERLRADGRRTTREEKPKADPEPVCKRCGLTCVSCTQDTVRDEAAEV